MSSLLDERYYGTVGTGVAAAAGVAVPGLFVPTLDTTGVYATWTVMVTSIAAKSEHKVSGATVAKVVAAAISAISAYHIGSKILTWAAAPLIIAFPVAGVPAAVAVNVMLNSVFTLKLGVAAAKQFSRPDFTASDVSKLALAIAGQIATLPKMEEIKLAKEMIEAFR